jgi:two-component system, chemotaxis family, chemotaxis protein CheY
MQTILIVDDSSTARMFIKRCLEISGCMDALFKEAADGSQALQILEQGPVDFIVADLNMPVLDGRCMLKQLKANPKTSAIPVVVITSASNYAANVELMSEGAYAVLSKPITPPMIISSLCALLKKQGGDHGAE